MKITLVVLIFTFTLISCTKNREQTVFISGTVVDFGSGEPIVDAKIHVKDGFNGSGPFTESDFTTDAEAIVYTDEKGFFEVELTGRFNPYLYPSKSDEYWPYDGGDNAVTSSAEVYKKGSENLNERIRLKSDAKMQGLIKFKDEVLDSIIVTQYRENVNQPSDRQWFESRNQFDFRNAAAIGNFHFRFQIEYKRNRVWKSVLDSVYITKGETFQDTIYY